MSYLTPEEARGLARTYYNKYIDELIRKAALEGKSQINVTSMQVSEKDIESLKVLGYNVEVIPSMTKDNISFISINWRKKIR